MNPDRAAEQRSNSLRNEIHEFRAHLETLYFKPAPEPEPVLKRKRWFN